MSWLDILAINAVAAVALRLEGRRAPLAVDRLAVACGGSLFIERERRRDAHAGRSPDGRGVANGEIVAIFPEGTTSDGKGLLPFHANLLQAAISTGTPVQPVALRFATPPPS